MIFADLPWIANDRVERIAEIIGLAPADIL